MLVRALIPVRNGDRDPRAPGDEFDIDPMDAFDLRAIGAVEILDPEFADVRAPSDVVPGSEEEFEDSGLIATLTQERDQARAERDAARADAAELRKLADGATAEILQLKARIVELEGAAASATPIDADEQSAAAGAAAPVTPPAAPSPAASEPAMAAKPRAARKTKPAA